MRKLWLCLFYALCVFTIVFSLFWMALPRLPLGRADSAEETPVPSLPSISVQAVPETGSTTYYLCDEGGRVVVWQCDADGTPVQRVLRTGIYVNLLPEGDALRVKQGLRLPSETELRQLLEDLGGESTKTPPAGGGFACLIKIMPPSLPAGRDSSYGTVHS